MDIAKALLIGTSTSSATASDGSTVRVPTAPGTAATRDSVAAAIIVTAAGKAAAVACAVFANPALAPVCDAAGAGVMTYTLAGMTFVGTWAFQFARRKIADGRAKA